MKLLALTLIFRATGAVVVALTWLLCQADRVHQRAWQACTRENLRTANVRQVARTHF